MIKLNLRIDPLTAFITGLNEASGEKFTVNSFYPLKPIAVEDEISNTSVELSVKPTEENYTGLLTRKYIRPDINKAVEKLSEDGKLRLYSDVDLVAADVVKELKIQTGIIVYEEDVVVNNDNRTIVFNGITLVGTLPFTREPARINLADIIPSTVDFYKLAVANMTEETKEQWINSLKAAVKSESFELDTTLLTFSEPSSVESTLNSRVTITIPEGHRLYQSGTLNVIYKRNPWGEQARVMGAEEGDIPVYITLADVKGNEEAIIAQLNEDYEMNLTKDETTFSYDNANPRRLGIISNNYQFQSKVVEWVEIKPKRTHLSEIFPEERLDMFDPLEYI